MDGSLSKYFVSASLVENENAETCHICQSHFKKATVALKLKYEGKYLRFFTWDFFADSYFNLLAGE